MLTFDGITTTLTTGINDAITIMREGEKAKRHQIWLVGGIIALGVILILRGR